MSSEEKKESYKSIMIFPRQNAESLFSDLYRARNIDFHTKILVWTNKIEPLYRKIDLGTKNFSTMFTHYRQDEV